MYFIGHHNDTLTVTNLRQTMEFTGSPHTPPGIVRMTEKKELASTYILLETFKIDLKLPVHEVESILAQRTSKVLRHMDIGMIHGRLDEDGITRTGKATDDECNTRDNTGHEVEPLGLYSPPIATLLPSHDR